MAILLLCVLSICGCAARKETSPQREIQPTFPTAATCPTLYVLAPGNYIVDLAADANVVLDPAWHEFMLYCDKSKARRDLEGLMDRSGLQADQWRIYTLEGLPEDIATIENGRLLLAKPARLSGWLGETE